MKEGGNVLIKARHVEKISQECVDVSVPMSSLLVGTTVLVYFLYLVKTGTCDDIGLISRKLTPISYLQKVVADSNIL